jgi:hypothetical protein
VAVAAVRGELDQYGINRAFKDTYRACNLTNQDYCSLLHSAPELIAKRLLKGVEDGKTT